MTLLHSRRRRARRTLAFTLVEMLVVLGIIALMAGLLFPALSSARNRALSMKCSGNLRSIGLAAMQAASDNNNQYPEIDQAALPIYPSGSDARGLVETLGPYGITTNTIQCPVDMARGGASAFTRYQSSYEWNPAFDDEVTADTFYYVAQGLKIPVNNARVRLCTDFDGIHSGGRQNAVYGDGHVKMH